MAELNIVERANKVLSFRKVIREICRKKGMEYPSDDKISEWINQQYGWDVDDFMKDYTEHEGIFRSPLIDFTNKVNEIEWGENKPTEDEIKAFVAENGYDLKKFIQTRTIASYSPLERATLNATLQIGDILLVKLWNNFIEESAIYGEDSYIYDLTDEKDVKFLRTHMLPSEFVKICSLAKAKKTNYVQWFGDNDGGLKAKTDIKGIIIAYWGEIFDRIMGFPTLYGNLNANQVGTDYFFDVFWPSVREFNGYLFDERDGSLKNIGKK